MSNENPTSDEDVLSEKNIHCPYTMHERMREKGNIIWNSRVNAWYVTGHDEVRQILEAPDVFSSVNSIYGNDGADRLAGLDIDLLITLDGARHKQIRELIVDAFKLNDVNTLWEPRARRIAQEQLDIMIARGTNTFVEHFAVPLPVRVVYEMLGISTDEEKIKQLRFLTSAVVSYLGHTNGDRFEERELEFMTIHSERLNALLEGSISEKKANPTDDLLSTIVHAEYDLNGEKQKLSDTQTLAFLSLILFAGNLTTTSLITQALVNLVRYPHEFQRLKNDYSKIPAFIEETLRLDPPAQGAYRRALQNVVIGGVEIKQGEQVFFSIGASGRDPKKFACPHAFQTNRPDIKDHGAFGYKKHYCIGAGLARMEARVALEEVLNRFESLTIPDGFQMEYLDAPLFRAPIELVLEYRTKTLGV